MNGRDERDQADSLLSDERVRLAVRSAFNRAPELQASQVFSDQLRDQLRAAAGHGRPPSTFTRRWFAVAASAALVTGLVGDLIVNRSKLPAGTLVQDAIGDHRNCALKFRLVRMPVPLEDAAQRYDSAYRLLLDAPPDAVSTPGGAARVLERHSCAYGTRRFGHVIMQYKGRVVSLLLTAGGDVAGADAADAAPHLIGRPVDGLSVVSVSGTRHAVLLVGDLGSDELTELSRVVASPLVQQMGSLASDRAALNALLLNPNAHLARE